MHTSSLRPSPLHKLAVTTGLLVAFIGGSALSLTQPQSAHAEADQSMSVCIQDTKSLSVLFLVDTSLSLKKTDARNRRVAAIQSALSALGALQSASNVKVQTEFLEFGTTTRRISSRSGVGSVVGRPCSANQPGRRVCRPEQERGHRLRLRPGAVG